MSVRPEKSCPIPKTHNRLRQVHDLWHEAAAAYPDADAFVTKLNACIQAARSVTFVLQKELKRRDWFEAFYEPWQERMKADPLMRWLVEARNAIEKQGDLDTDSVARVSVLTTDDEVLVAELDVPPLASPEEVAETVEIAELPERVRKQAVMAVERLWTVPDIPGDSELLDAVGHCYGVLASVVADAHEKCGSAMRTFGGETHDRPHERHIHPSGRLPCMLPTAETRTAYWHLGQESLLEYGTRAIERPAAAEIAEGAARYGLGGSDHRLFPGMPMAEQVAALHEIGKVILTKDGFHGTYAWLYRGGDRVGQLAFFPEDHQGKIVAMRALASEVDEVGADAVVYAVEAWFAPAVPPSDPRFDLRATDRDDRQEAFLTYWLSRDGDRRLWTTIFGRDDEGQPVLQDTSTTELTEQPLFRPVERVWESWGADPDV